MKLNHKVTEAVWQEELGQWKVTVDNGGRAFFEYADFLVSAQGVLRYVDFCFSFYIIRMMLKKISFSALGVGPILRTLTNLRVTNAIQPHGTRIMTIPVRPLLSLEMGLRVCK